MRDECEENGDGAPLQPYDPDVIVDGVMATLAALALALGVVVWLVVRLVAFVGAMEGA
jgi:hypothetical protein